MHETARLPSLALIALLASCASQEPPIVDLKGVSRAQFESDLADCEAYADGVPAARRAAGGAVAGAAVGAAIGAIHGEADRGAGYGGIVGAARGGVSGDRLKRQVVRRCLSGRGYRVLD